MKRENGLKVRTQVTKFSHGINGEGCGKQGTFNRMAIQEAWREIGWVKDRRGVEDYRPGYPRFSALVAAHNSFLICRRFSNLRTRLLLLKQDKLSMLEQQLEDIDANERAPLFLGSSRDDRNEERSSTISDIDNALADYDNFVERNRRMLESEVAKPRDIRSLQNWVNGNGCLSWEETEYLNHCNDLRSIVPLEDSATVRFEAWVEDSVVRLLMKLQSRSHPNLSRDPHVFIFPTQHISKVARILIVLLIIVLLSVPIIICHSISSSSARVSVIVLSLVVFLAILSGLVTKRTNELFLAGVTYTTVLVVFVSSTNPGAN
ncbi:hypothetical protein K469DRAFT_743122 [Zopfia rhizophila CBS 207.26]|uniref:DUF6594 domain-containing protein n=1 Tax=Zopfia rhizophila CBS 207.26 TaxID=1314779 RepID=A0A6A6D9C6_9PEZI|nr:hypothetical protein K469DRAFT_743122 [Zopfia rhizophila CBS 207.26]